MCPVRSVTYVSGRSLLPTCHLGRSDLSQFVSALLDCAHFVPTQSVNCDQHCIFGRPHL